MKKFRIIYLVYLIVITFLSIASANKTDDKTVGVTAYFADKQMMRLIPFEYYIPKTNTRKMCQYVLDELVKERAYDSNIRTIISSDAVSFKINNDIAVVDIKSECFGKTEKVKPLEDLIVYQLVNSLCSVEGVNGVEFTIDGKKEKNFFGFIDMREVFVSQNV